ncbi:MAG: M1 family aminopeptidase [Candidatus Neomarinimicrobiota bacterium]
MRALFTLFIFSQLISAQNSDIYKRPFQSQPDFDLDVLHYEINLKINDHDKTFYGKTSIDFKVLKSKVDTVRFDTETFRVTRVEYDTSSLSFVQADGSVMIMLDTPIYRDEERKYTIHYQSDGKIADPAEYNMGGVRVLGLGFFDQSEDNPALVQTHSFPEGARHWFPSNDHPADKATSSIITTVRSDWKVLSNGVLNDKTTNWKRLQNGMRIRTEGSGDSTTYRWDLDLPNSTYLYVMVAGPFEVVQDYHGDIPMSYWVYPQDKENAHRSFHRTPEIMRFFEKEYGTPYPWPKMDQITIPGIGGGAESTTATILGEKTIHDEKAEKDYPSHWLVAHEAAHQWWGDYITMGNWHHAWLNESFATYGEYLYSSYLYGKDESKINLWKKKQSYLNEYKNRYSRPMVHPYWQYPNQNFDSHIYPRGAAVLHMLRQIVGDKTFKEFQEVFLNKYAYGNPVTDDLIKVVNEVSEKDLTWFFKQWVLSAGHPQLDIKTEWKGDELTVHINQTQIGRKTPTKYYLPTTIAFFYKNEIVKKEIIIDRKRSIHRFKMKKDPLFVRFDPENDLLVEVNQNYSYNGLLSQLKRDNVIGRMEASKALKAYLEDPKTIRALKRSAVHDRSWFVRKAALESVAREMSSKDFLIAFIREKHSQPRRVIVSKMSKYFPADAVRLIRKYLDTDESYIVQAEMIRQLGRVGDESDIEKIEFYNKQWSPRKILRNASVKALAELKGN